MIALIYIAAVPGRKEFGRVRVAHDHARQHGHFGHFVQVPHGDVALQVHGLARDDQQRKHHAKAGIDGACNKVRRKDGGMPAGQH